MVAHLRSSQDQCSSGSPKADPSSEGRHRAAAADQGRFARLGPNLPKIAWKYIKPQNGGFEHLQMISDYGKSMGDWFIGKIFIAHLQVHLINMNIDYE